MAQSLDLKCGPRFGGGIDGHRRAYLDAERLNGIDEMAKPCRQKWQRGCDTYSSPLM